MLHEEERGSHAEQRVRQRAKRAERGQGARGAVADVESCRGTGRHQGLRKRYPEEADSVCTGRQLCLRVA